MHKIIANTFVRYKPRARTSKIKKTMDYMNWGIVRTMVYMKWGRRRTITRKLQKLEAPQPPELLPFEITAI